MSGTPIIIIGIISFFFGAGLLITGRKIKPKNDYVKPSLKSEDTSNYLKTDAISSKEEELLEFIKISSCRWCNFFK